MAPSGPILIVDSDVLFQGFLSYNLAQVVDVEELGADGKLTLVIAEGLIEDVQVRFINKEGSLVDDQKKPIGGTTRPFIITREVELKAGKIFNRNIFQRLHQ